MKLERMIGILSILLQHQKVTAAYLAEKFEVSRRTIHRDIEALCIAGIPLVTEPGVNGGVSIMDDYKIDRTLLSSSDMQAILAGLRSLDSISGTNRYAQLMEKLSAGSSNPLAGDTHILIDLSSWYKASLSPKIDFRLFKLGRMTGLQTKESFEKRAVPLPNFSPEQIFPYLYQVKAKIHPQYKWRLIEEYGAESFTIQPDGMLLFSAGFTDKASILSWIISFGEDAELLEPSEFRKDILEYAEKICKKYLQP